jgi:rhodanese-related sulfurtransferase
MALTACQPAATSSPLVYTKYENEAAVPRISPQDAKKEVDAGTAIFVDSRGEAAFEQEHLPGAVVIPFGSGDEKFNSLPKGKKIIVYCS